VYTGPAGSPQVTEVLQPAVHRGDDVCPERRPGGLAVVLGIAGVVHEDYLHPDARLHREVD
jgi:hypothetical protein